MRERSRKGESERAEPSGQRAHRAALGGVRATLQDVRVELLLRLLHPPLRRARLQNSGRSASGVRTQRLLLCAKQSNRGGAPFRRRAGELLGGGLVHLRPDSSSAAQLPRAGLEEEGAEQEHGQPTGCWPQKTEERLKGMWRGRNAGVGALSQRARVG